MSIIKEIKMAKLINIHGHEIYQSLDAASAAASVADAATRAVSICDAALAASQLAGVDAGRIDARWANMSDADLRGADFTFARLEGVDLRGADTRRADFAWADLREAKIDLSLLREAETRGTDLRGTQVYRGDVMIATLTGNGGIKIPGGPAGDYILLATTKGWVVAKGGTLCTLAELEAFAKAPNSSMDDRRASATIAAYIEAR
jgi:hypothetical protein